jgi:RNA polymerase sigma-70 factor (ECF subfamily)
MAATDSTAGTAGSDTLDFGDALVALTDRLRRRAYRLTRDVVHAEDLLQETLAKAWSARRSFQPGTNLQAWTYTILRNVFLTDCRRLNRVEGLDEKMAVRLPDTGADQYQQAELAAVLRAIDRLPTDQRSAILAIALEELDYDVAAARLNISPGALKSRVRRGRLVLARMVEEGIPRPQPIERERLTSSQPTHFKGVWKAAKAAGESLWIG